MCVVLLSNKYANLPPPCYREDEPLMNWYSVSRNLGWNASPANNNHTQVLILPRWKDSIRCPSVRYWLCGKNPQMAKDTIADKFNLSDSMFWAQMLIFYIGCRSFLQFSRVLRIAGFHLATHWLSWYNKYYFQNRKGKCFVNCYS